jgi:molybdopterin synthase sulfur carrier subunit
MKVTVEYFLTFREHTGKKGEDLKIGEETTVGEILKLLAHKYGEELREALFDEGGNLKNYVRVLMDGQDIQGLKGIYTILQPNCTLSIFPPAAGGET